MPRAFLKGALFEIIDFYKSGEQPARALQLLPFPLPPLCGCCGLLATARALTAACCTRSLPSFNSLPPFYQIPPPAPYKRRGTIPFGVQRGSYGLTSEEKMRRAWREWSAASDGASPAALLDGDAAAAPSFSALVSSFRRVVAADAPAEVDVRDLVADASVLPDALQLSKESVIEWMEVQEGLLQRQEKDKQKQFVFKVKAP